MSQWYITGKDKMKTNKKNLAVALLSLIMVTFLLTSCGVLSSDTVGGVARDSYRYIYGN